MITFGTANSEEDLKSILLLQEENLPTNISEKEAQSQGFVTVHHDLDLLSKMNTPFPHVVAKVENQVVGYALVMLRKWEKDIPVLVPMFQQINSIKYANELLQDASYFIMGQVCIAKDYRGQGVFQGLYNEMKKRMQSDFDYVITEVATRNIRSIKAHLKAGFENIKTYKAEDGEEWAILLWKF